MNKELDVDSAINLLKSGGKLDDIIISDLATSKVQMMDALLLARNGYIVPEDNVVYDDAQIQYDPDFDDVAWGQPVPFKKLIPSLESGAPLTEKAKFNDSQCQAIIHSHLKGNKSVETIWGNGTTL